jgi:hypothetical protein
MKHFKLHWLAALVLIAFTSNSCKENIVNVPPPEFAPLMVEASPIVGFKRLESSIPNDVTFLSRHTQIVIKQTNNPNEVIFEETFLEADQPRTLSYTVMLGEKGRNAVKITIPPQNSGGTNLAGVPLEDNSPDVTQGAFEAFESDGKTKANRLFFRMQVGNRRWVYNFPQSCPSGTTWNGSACR